MRHNHIRFDKPKRLKNMRKRKFLRPTTQCTSSDTMIMFSSDQYQVHLFISSVEAKESRYPFTLYLKWVIYSSHKTASCLTPMFGLIGLLLDTYIIKVLFECFCIEYWQSMTHTIDFPQYSMINWQISFHNTYNVTVNVTAASCASLATLIRNTALGKTYVNRVHAVEDQSAEAFKPRSSMTSLFEQSRL